MCVCVNEGVLCEGSVCVCARVFGCGGVCVLQYFRRCQCVYDLGNLGEEDRVAAIHQ